MGYEIWMPEKLKNGNFERNVHSTQKVFFSQFRHQTWSKVIFGSIRKPTLFCKYFWFTRTFILLSISSTSDRVRMTNRRQSIGGHNVILFLPKIVDSLVWNRFFWDFVPNIGPHPPTAHVWDSVKDESWVYFAFWAVKSIFFF